MKSWIDIAIAGRTTERHRLSSGTTIVGSEPPADIALRGVTALLPEHFSLRPQPEGCWVELVENAPEPFTFDGRPSRGCLVPWEQEIFYGAVRLTFHGEATAEDAKRKVSPVLWAAVVVVPLASFLLVNKHELGAHALDARGGKPPAMFGDAPICAEGPQGALGRGNIAEQTAHAKHERGAFEVVDAVQAVELLREAAQCYLLAGYEGDAARANRAAASWIDKLGLTYQRALLDFELARRAGRAPAIVDASAKLQTLLTYAGPQGVKYKAWLEQVVLAQRAERAAKAASKKEKKK